MVLALGALWTLSLAGLFAAAITDFRHRIIPNRLVWLTAGCGIAMRLLTEPRSLGLSIGAAAAILLALGVLAHRQVIGGGDAKLIAAATLLVAPHEIGGLLLIIALGGGFISAIYLLAHLASRRASFAKITGDCTSAGLSLENGLRRATVAEIARGRSIPYGLAIFAGTVALALNEATRWLSAIF